MQTIVERDVTEALLLSLGNRQIRKGKLLLKAKIERPIAELR